MLTMQPFATPPRLVTLLSLTVVLMLAVGMPTARAQYGGLGPSASNPASLSGSGASSQIGPGPSIKGPAPTPAALPGAAARSDRVAPSQGVVIANPTDALFDAVNRGDIVSARDAIDRGADLDGHNVLGMTPLDLAVDLGRNDITFLLLSLRSGDSRPGLGAGSQTAKNGQPAKPGLAAKTGKPAPGHASATGHTTMAARPATPPARQAAPAMAVSPRLFAGDGGTPNPGVGFLGFDNKH
jgi:hypothetical protein